MLSSLGIFDIFWAQVIQENFVTVVRAQIFQLLVNLTLKGCTLVINCSQLHCLVVTFFLKCLELCCSLARFLLNISEEL